MYNEKCSVLEAVVSSATGFSQNSWEEETATYHLQTDKNGKFKLARRRAVKPDKWLESILQTDEKPIPEKEKHVNEIPAKDKTVNQIPAKDKTVKDIPAKDKTVNQIPAKDKTVKEIPAKDKTAKEIPAKDITAKYFNEIPVKGKPANEKQVNVIPAQGKTVNQKIAKEKPAKEDRSDPATLANPQVKENVPFKNIDCVKHDFKGKPLKQDVFPPIIWRRLFQARDNSIT